MKRLSLSYYHLLVQIAITVELIIIAVAIPSASLAEINYYKALLIGYFKKPGHNRKHNSRQSDQILLRHS